MHKDNYHALKFYCNCCHIVILFIHLLRLYILKHTHYRSYDKRMHNACYISSSFFYVAKHKIAKASHLTDNILLQTNWIFSMTFLPFSHPFMCLPSWVRCVFMCSLCVKQLYLKPVELPFLRFPLCKVYSPKLWLILVCSARHLF